MSSDKQVFEATYRHLSANVKEWKTEDLNMYRLQKMRDIHAQQRSSNAHCVCMTLIGFIACFLLLCIAIKLGSMHHLRKLIS
jgi:hypothetical protein